ncbi:hypothetical protein [Hymenobacter psychrophilus]|uniref:Phospholipase_D-nuclease N-terminal n=1 Tax=Hymenobacter psychrophilus TaxID=651662 RepID=A0A1H3FJS1_9BACT|nr:hypothetical protein [Hymenobacter psychrophilus]SDX90628.1 hypothetical protein SAMN04488069_10486 [Hymenobacter psychrophilus]
MNFFLSFLGLFWCVGSIVVLATLLTWHERAATPPERSRRLLAVVLPAAALLLGSVLWALLHVMLLWGPGAAAVAVR